MSFVTIARMRGKSFVQAVLAHDAASLAEQEAEIARRVRLEVNRSREKATAEGRRQGELEAQALLQPQAAALQDAAAALREAVNQLASPLAGQHQALAALVTELAFLLTRHIVGRETSGPPEALKTLVQRLLAEAAAERGPRQTLLLRLNPEDCKQLRDVIDLETASLLADQNITRGGALVEISNPDGDPVDRIEWDATIEGRLATIRTALALPDEVPPA